jgi:hypothetical protein
MSKKVSASARVQVTVEFTAVSWGSDCSVQQVFDQAGREIVSKVHSLIAEKGGRVIGEPRVIAVMGEME